jgi:hypothetical protein
MTSLTQLKKFVEMTEVCILEVKEVPICYDLQLVSSVRFLNSVSQKC